ncbi:hypothetical protein BVG19_g5083 [[Candida] boidinii]|nr:hypothetical protein BVG19_g5083 [[Candida] boidinii]OWB53651.1 hypothetical protein B5S27_g5257 [[Candida] boidinii]GMF56105.1 unnamed protein product [[Candida] boidinii]
MSAYTTSNTNTTTNTNTTKVMNKLKMVSPRSILKFMLCMEQGEGVGAKVRRSIGTMGMRNFTPFLMLDHFNVDPEAGFPDHPHRGQETITYLIKGEIAHEDFTGSTGILYPGDLQFMTAGKGIVHAEMPCPQPDGSPVEGMQLWVDLPAELKHSNPRYKDLRKAEIPIAKPDDKVEVKVISGKSYGIDSVKDLAYTPIDYYHYTVQPGGKFTQQFPEDYNVFLYLMHGNLTVGGKNFPQYNALFFKRDGEAVVGEVPADSKEAANFVLIGGQVLDQPIVQHGPFVETSKEGIYQAFMDYQMGANGFEKARGWSSKIGHGVDAELVRVLSHKDEANAANKKDEL